MPDRPIGKFLSAILALIALSACSGKPLNPWTVDSPPLALVPIADAAIDDQRGRFREVFCAVLSEVVSVKYFVRFWNRAARNGQTTGPVSRP